MAIPSAPTPSSGRPPADGGRAPSTTSVQALEITADLAPDHADHTPDPLETQSRAQRRLHAPHQRSRRLIITALHEDPGGRHASRVARMADCCRGPMIAQTDAGLPTLSLGRCRDRLCPLCARYRAAESASRLTRLIQRMDAPRFITLTLDRRDETLPEQLARLRLAFRRLRQQQIWRRGVRGGVYAIECTWSPDRGEWHPHLHIVYDGDYIPHASLKRAWQAASTGAFIVDIRAVRSRRQVAHYIAKYVTKAAETVAWPAAQIREYATAMAGQRAVHTFGSLHGREPTPADAEPRVGLHSTTIGVHALLDAAAGGDRDAQYACHVLARLGGPWNQLFNPCPTPYADRAGPTPDDTELRAALHACTLVAARLEGNDTDGDSRHGKATQTQTCLFDTAPARPTYR